MLNVDTYHTSLWVEFDKEFLNNLEKGKKQAQHFDRPMPFKLGSNWWLIHPFGIKNYAYRLVSDDIQLLVNKRDAQKSIPNCRLTVGSISSHAYGLSVYQDLCNVFERSGSHVVKDTISRLDICYDLDLPIEQCNLLDANQRITRFQRHAAYWSTALKFSGSTFGSGNVVCRIYDKIQEMNDKQSMKKIDFFNFTTPITRVEFQLRRDFLVQFETEKGKIYNTTQAFESISELWGYLTTTTIKFVEPFDRKNQHQSLAVVTEWWLKVQSQSKSEPANRFRQPKRICPEKNFEQAAGLIIPACAVLENTTDYSDVAKRVISETKKFLLHFYYKNFHRIQNAVILANNAFCPKWEQNKPMRLET